MNFLKRIIRSLFLKYLEEGRYILEKRIFKFLKNKNAKILFVGVAKYTKDYPKLLKGNELYTIDIDPSVAKYGSKNHVIGSVLSLTKFYKKNFFDYILLSGVIGYGVNTEKEANKTLSECYDVLKKGGILIVQNTLKKKNNLVDIRKLKKYKIYSLVNFIDYPPIYITKDRNRIFYFLKK